MLMDISSEMIHSLLPLFMVTVLGASALTVGLIEGLAEADALPGVHVLHAGTTAGEDGSLVSSGGRVLSVVGVGADIDAARTAAYAGVDAIALRGSHHRSDIAARMPEL